MENFTKLFNHMIGRNENIGLFDGVFDIGGSDLLLVLGLCLIATQVLASVANRTSIFEYGVTFASLLLGALLGHGWIAHVELPVANELAQTAVTANIGMTVAALLLLGLYRTEG